MGIQDRDYYRDHYRSITASERRRTSPSTLRIAAFWIVVGVCAFAAFRLIPLVKPATGMASSSSRVPPTLQPPVAIGRGMQAGASQPQAPRSVPDAATPGAPASAAPIYRCGNVYSHSPCAGGRTVDAPAATGFDSTPSAKLAALVAEGRVADGSSTFSSSTSTVTTINGQVISSSGSGASNATLCRALGVEIDGIDRAARQALPAYEQDRLRNQRRDARNRQIALHC